jgi:hypothetical protein
MSEIFYLFTDEAQNRFLKPFSLEIKPFSGEMLRKIQER